MVLGGAGGDHETVAAAAIVLALPPALAVERIAFAPALPPGVTDAARAVHTWMGDTVKVAARFAEPVWREAGLAGAALSHAGPAFPGYLEGAVLAGRRAAGQALDRLAAIA